jgi:4-hydroxy-tetrahydrodipicolinate reductase
MKVALIGYGKMGHEIEKILLDRGHQIILIIDKDNQPDIKSEKFKAADVAIEFTTPHSAIENIKASTLAGVPLVCGSTGWLDRLPEMEEFVTQNNGGLFYASNFSLGVNIFFHVNEYLAKIMAKLKDYSVEMEEWHHNQKLDAPSGTAITLAEHILKEYPQKTGWINESTTDDSKLGIISIRKGDIPGIHTVTYNSPVDTITLTHDAKSRQGFALGAVLAAEYLVGKKGIHTMNDLLTL